MGRFKGWVKAKLGRQEPPASTAQACPTPGVVLRDSVSAQPRPVRRSSSSTLPPDKGIVSSQLPTSTSSGKANAATAPLVEASSTPHAQATSDYAAPPYSLPQRLWNQAYDQAKANDSETVDAYEKFLSARYSEKDDSTNLTTQQNCIERNPDKRREQMQKLLQDGLKRIAKEKNVKQGMESGIQAVLAVKEVVDKAVQASSEAALAWVGVCFALEILMNPLTEASSNRQGIAYVVSRMDWYLNLSDLLLNENIEAHSQSLRGKLEKIITQLYAKLLLYQMKSVCYYHRGRFAVLVGDLVKHYNWDGELSDIKAAEAAVQQDLDEYNTQSIRTRLGDIAKTAKSQNAKLDSISSAIHEQTKQQKTMHETSEDHKCLRDLRATDPRDDKKRIEDLKGGLLKDSYRWILGNSDFQKWHDGPQSRLLWVKADPGKGKTMLLCGIIDELEKSNTPGLLAYFFCQAADLRINSATAVLRGLVYLLVEQQPSLISHVREKYDRAGQGLFKDANAWVALSGIFTGILQDAELKNTYLIIDALDECTTDLPKLLDFIAKNSSVSPRVKWIVSSRNWPDIEEHLRQAGDKVKLSLELNEESISAAVSTFIEDRVSGLAQRKGYDERTRDDVLKYLASNASDTFLWVALVCKNLENVPRRNVMKKLNSFPPGLDDLYTQMMRQISNSDDANVCKRILASIVIVYRPITTKEMASLIQQLEDIADDRESIQEIISSCGSFLTLREETVYFVHQSAKDFLLTKPSKETPKGAFDEIFPSGTSDVHYALFSASLQTMSSTLRRDMYDLRALGYPAEQVSQPDPDPLAASRYACFYWIDHLHDSHPNPSSERATTLRDGGSVDTFLRQKYLYWLESLSLCKGTSKGVDSMAKLEALVQGSSDADALSKLVQDARRFIMYHKGAIEHSPLQAYASALLFSPASSLVRRLFKGEEPKWATIKPGVGDAWSACLQTLEGHSSSVRSVAFSHDSTRLASASWDKTIKVWDASSGACLQTLEGHSNYVWSVAFSHDSTRLASASGDKTIKIWDASSGACLRTLKGHGKSVWSVAFSHDSTRLASASGDRTIKIWDASSGACLQTLEGHSRSVNLVAFSHDSTRLASVSWDKTIKIWDASSGACLQIIQTKQTLQNISFDTTGSLLYSDIGTIALSGSQASRAMRVAEPQHPQYQGGGVSSDGA